MLVSFCSLEIHAAQPHPFAGPGNFELHPGLDLTLFTSEPDVVDPVALCFDAVGRMFVVEMRDYPYGLGADRKTGGTIRMLEDTDHDGRADRSVIFAEGLSFPTSIAPWKDGVIVTAPPEVIYLADTNGDGRADVREVLLKGFTLGVTDSNVNGLRWGLDNRLHGLNGGNGGNITSTRRPGSPVPLRNFDFSFDPATGEFAPTFHTSGGFGLVFDEWGRSFVTYNINHLQQRIIPVRYLDRFPGMPPVEATASISDHGEMSRIFPASEPETRVNHPEQSGHFSSAGGMGYVGAAGYPGDLPGSVFVCDVVGNLVHRDILTPDGPIFTARRSPVEQTNEFFASRDRAFRPVGLELGPDGALYLLDMQRDVIEHPDYIPDKVKQKIDLRAGQDRGRIYRISPKGAKPTTRPLLASAMTAQLIAALSDSNQWTRATAQRLLVERADKSAIPALRKLAHGNHPPGTLHALWTLTGLNALDETSLFPALTSHEAGLRENALQLAESLLPGSKKLRARIIAVANDPSPRVRFQAALTLGQLPHQDALPALTRIFEQDHTQRWSRLAILASLQRDEATLLRRLMAGITPRTPTAGLPLETLRDLAEFSAARAARDPAKLEALLTLIQSGPETEPVRVTALDGLQAGLARTGGDITATGPARTALDQIARTSNSAILTAAWKLSRTLQLPETASQRTALVTAKTKATDPALPLAERSQNIRLLALGTYATSGEALATLLAGTQPAALQQAAIEALGQFRETAVASNLVARWRSLAPSVHTPALALLLQRVAFHEVLVDAIERGRIQLGELNLDLEQRRRLLRESTAPIMARAAKLLGDEEYSNRKKVVEDWLRKLPATGEPTRGRNVFEKTCAPCHAVAGLGNQVGPDLGALAHRSVEDLLSNILDPNMAIHPGYVSTTAETEAGEIETGILQSETADTVILLQPGAKKVVLPRREIKRLETSGTSLMPEGLEAGMTPADLRDLIAFIQGRK